MTGKSPKWAERTVIEPNEQGSIRSHSGVYCLEDIVRLGTGSTKAERKSPCLPPKYPLDCLMRGEMSKFSENSNCSTEDFSGFATRTGLLALNFQLRRFFG
jgi:hypothetical protein